MKKREAAKVRPFLLAELRPNITNIPTRAYLGEIREKNIIAADQPQNTSSYLSRKAKSAVDRPSHASNSSLQPFVERDISAPSDSQGRRRDLLGGSARRPDVRCSSRAAHPFRNAKLTLSALPMTRERQVGDEEVRGAPPQLFSIDRM
jgi:hypothetical protein